MNNKKTEEVKVQYAVKVNDMYVKEVDYGFSSIGEEDSIHVLNLTKEYDKALVFKYPDSDNMDSSDFYQKREHNVLKKALKEKKIDFIDVKTKITTVTEVSELKGTVNDEDEDFDIVDAVALVVEYVLEEKGITSAENLK